MDQPTHSSSTKVRLDIIIIHDNLKHNNYDFINLTEELLVQVEEDSCLVETLMVESPDSVEEGGGTLASDRDTPQGAPADSTDSITLSKNSKRIKCTH